MNRILGVFRGFPGLGRVVAGVSLMETLRDNYNCDIKIITYLQGNKYLQQRGYVNLFNVEPMDYCSLGLLPTGQMGSYIHKTIKEFQPELILIDGEPLILHSIKISYPLLPVVALLNPTDIDNPQNDKEAMNYFKTLYSLADVKIVHGLRRVKTDNDMNNTISVGTIIRNEIFQIKNNPKHKIYCLLGGGTINVGEQFKTSTIKIANLCIDVAKYLPDYTMNIVCADSDIYNSINQPRLSNLKYYEGLLNANKYYSDATLIITRSGRNTLSELAYLNIPTLTLVAGCPYRVVEQQQNIENINAQNIRTATVNESAYSLAQRCKELINTEIDKPSKFVSGNIQSVQKILTILNEIK